MNFQYNQIRELIFYGFELGQNATEVTKNICCAKVESTIDHRSVIRWFKKFRSGCKNLNDQTRSGRAKTVNYEAMF